MLAGEPKDKEIHLHQGSIRGDRETEIRYPSVPVTVLKLEEQHVLRRAHFG